MIRLRKVRKTFPSQQEEEGAPRTKPVLAVAELDFDTGGRVALMGASGSGKTTLLNLVSGLILPDVGCVEIDGTDIAKLSESKRDRFRARNIGYVFQTFHLLDGYTAMENVELGASFVGKRSEPARADRLLDAVGLGHRLRHMPSQLSVGQQSRVALARALINTPKVLLADEPTGALDAETGTAVLDLLLGTAQEQKITLVCATHDPSVAERFDRTIRVEELQ